MGKFADLIPQPAFIRTDAQDEKKGFTVHGLALEDLSKILIVYRDDFLMLLVSAQQAGGNPDWTRILMSAPSMVADLIACAADATDEESVGEVRRMPAVVQLAALAEIWRLSVPDPKKLQGLLSVAMAKARSFSENAKKLAQVAGVKLEMPSTSSKTTAPASSPT